MYRVGNLDLYCNGWDYPSLQYIVRYFALYKNHNSKKFEFIFISSHFWFPRF